MRNIPPFAVHQALRSPNMFGSAAGVSPKFIASGAYRTMRYEDWVEQERAQAEQGGRRAYLPPVDQNGVPLDIAHYASRDEMVEWAGKILAESGRNDAEKARLAEVEARMSEDFKEAVGSGDPEKIKGVVRSALLQLRDTDPVMWPAVTPTPHDFTTEFGTIINQTEIIPLCEELGLYNALPEVINGSNQENWLEMTELEFASGCDSCAFTPGLCPEDFVHDSETKYVHKRHIGVKKSLTESDIRHSAAAIAAGVGINSLVGGFNQQGLPGESDAASLIRGSVADLKEKELRLAMVLVLNCWDDLLVNGSNFANPLEFDGIRNRITAINGARSCPTDMTGTFSASRFDQFLAAGCATPQAIIGHPAALAQLALAYYGIGAQTVIYNDKNEGLVPGLNFASQIMAGIGPVALIGDTRFPRQDLGNGSFTTDLYPVRLTQNGEPLIYKATQIPLAAKDLTPGCTAISFEIWAVTALVVKAMCAQAVCRVTFNGILSDGCHYVDPCTPVNYLRAQ